MLAVGFGVRYVEDLVPCKLSYFMSGLAKKEHIQVVSANIRFHRETNLQIP